MSEDDTEEVALLKEEEWLKMSELSDVGSVKLVLIQGSAAD